MRQLENILLYIISVVFIGFMGWLIYRAADWIPVAFLVALYAGTVVWSHHRGCPRR